jgi:hypothetical protein
MKHKLNSKGEAETTDGKRKIADDLMPNQPIANAAVSGSGFFLFVAVYIQV